MISVQIAPDLSIPLPPETVLYLERAAQETLLEAGGPGAASLSIVVTGDAQMQELNRQYRGIHAPTDVLSFASNEIDPDTGESYLGDILISYPRALEQAQAGGHPVADELALLAVHGALHLLGYDHDLPAEKERMWARQAIVLQRLDCSIDGPPADID
jgi:probable rRNA maturation factor